MVLNVKKAFLYGAINRPVYIELPADDLVSAFGAYAGRVEKVMYGSRDAPQVWQPEVRKTMESLGFVGAVSTPCLCELLPMSTTSCAVELMRRSSTWEDWKESRPSSADKALYLFGSDSALRLRCACLVQSPSYNAFVATATVAGTIFIIISPQTASTSDHQWAGWQLIVTVVNISFAAVFILDSVVNVISSGLVAYWRTDIFCKIGM